jgi:AcrR family transcriptional regulator
MLRAAETLLRRQSFEEISIARIVRRAKTSVGSFYARFGSKEGMLPLLYERYDARLASRFDPVVTGRVLPEVAPAVLLRRVVAEHVRAFRQRRWLLHALGLYARRQPQRISAAMQSRREEMHRHMAETLAAGLGKIDRPNPVAAVQRGLFFVSAICRDKIVFPAPHARATELSDDELIEELTRMFLRYLGIEDASGKRETKRSRKRAKRWK